MGVIATFVKLLEVCLQNSRDFYVIILNFICFT